MPNAQLIISEDAIPEAYWAGSPDVYNVVRRNQGLVVILLKHPFAAYEFANAYFRCYPGL